MGDINHRCAKAFVQARDFQSGLHPQCGIQVRERLIKQKNLRLTNNRAADCNTLPLATGHRLGRAIKVILQLQKLRRFLNALLDFGLRCFGLTQTESHVLEHIHMRVKCVGLKDHRHAAFGRVNLVHDLSADGNLTARDFLQTCDHAKQRGLATTRRTYENDKLAILDIKVHAMHHLRVAIFFDDILDRYAGHFSSILLIARSNPGANSSYSSGSCDHRALQRAKANSWPGSNSGFNNSQ